MADDILQSRSPAVTQPMVLDGEATRAAGDDLQSILARNTRRRGRPPGSRNKPKVTPETGRIREPRQRAQQARELTDAEARKKRLKAKKDSADAWEKKILEEANDGIFSVLIMAGVPPEFLYKEPPESKGLNPNYTPWANRIAIQPMHAKVYGLTIAEFETSAIGATISGTIQDDSPWRLGLLVIGSVLMASQQVNAILQLRKELEPYLKAWKAARDQKQQQEDGNA